MANLVNDIEMARIKKLTLAQMARRGNIEAFLDVTQWSPEKLQEVSERLLNETANPNQLNMLCDWSRFLNIRESLKNGDELPLEIYFC